MTNYDDVNLEPVRDLIEPKLMRYYAAMNDAAESVANEIVQNGELSEIGRAAFLDENMLQASILGDDYREAAKTRDVYLPDGFVVEMEERLIEKYNEEIEKLITRLESLKVESMIPPKM